MLYYPMSKKLLAVFIAALLLTCLSSCDRERVKEFVDNINYKIDHPEEFEEPEEITPEERSRRREMWRVIDLGYVNHVRKYLEEGYDPDKSIGEFYGDSTPLSIVARRSAMTYQEYVSKGWEAPDPLPIIEILRMLVDAGADVNNRPYIWYTVNEHDNSWVTGYIFRDIHKNRISWTPPETEEETVERRRQNEEAAITYVGDGNRHIEEFIKAGADPDKRGHPYPYSIEARRRYGRNMSDIASNKYFEIGTRPINEAIKKGMWWESQVDLFLRYTTLDEDSLAAARESEDPAMIEKIERIWNEQRETPRMAATYEFNLATDDGFKFDIFNNSVIVKGYTGNSRTPVIPERIRGFPVTTIGKSAFKNSPITGITLPSTLTAIEWGAFEGSSITSINIPSSVTAIKNFAFHKCLSLANITVSPSVTAIGIGTFYGCESLAGINIPSSVTTIERYAFGKSGLTGITIPSSVTKIEQQAFYGCERLARADIPTSVTTIEDGVFSMCPGLQGITIDSRNRNFAVTDGVLFSKDMSTLVSYPAGKRAGSYTIPSSVTTIKAYAFSGNTHLTSVTIPSSVTTIERHTFSNTGLTNITFPPSVTTIGVLAFANCRGFTDLTFPVTITRIGDQAFYNCENLELITYNHRMLLMAADAFPQGVKHKYSN
jgi:hypothetical protein